MFVTSDGSPYARFQRALASGNEALVVAAAKELPRIALDDALRICLLLRDGSRPRYERAAVRWLGRFALEARGVTIDDLRLAAAALDALPERTSDAMDRLLGLCVARGIY
jgi:hypothetical protein